MSWGIGSLRIFNRCRFRTRTPPPPPKELDDRFRETNLFQPRALASRSLSRPAKLRFARRGRAIAYEDVQLGIRSLLSSCPALGRASTSCFVPARKTWMARTSPAMTMPKQRLHSGHSSYAIALPASGRGSAAALASIWSDPGNAEPGYFAWGCFRYFGSDREPRRPFGWLVEP
jgi:hypothetical protein